MNQFVEQLFWILGGIIYTYATFVKFGLTKPLDYKLTQMSIYSSGLVETMTQYRDFSLPNRFESSTVHLLGQILNRIDRILSSSEGGIGRSRRFSPKAIIMKLQKAEILTVPVISNSSSEVRSH